MGGIVRCIHTHAAPYMIRNGSLDTHHQVTGMRIRHFLQIAVHGTARLLCQILSPLGIFLCMALGTPNHKTLQFLAFVLIDAGKIGYFFQSRVSIASPLHWLATLNIRLLTYSHKIIQIHHCRKPHPATTDSQSHSVNFSLWKIFYSVVCLPEQSIYHFTSTKRYLPL